MLKLTRGTLLVVFPAWVLFTITTSMASGLKLDVARIEQLTGAKGKMNEKEGVFKVSVPRSDLSVVVAGVQMTPPMGLTSWAAFQKAREQTADDASLRLFEYQDVEQVFSECGLYAQSVRHVSPSGHVLLLNSSFGLDSINPNATALERFLAR